ncbi:hypothetical protein [Spongiactinospora sp. TRM90649]|uniref:hypothetical protein n=1 Tax=Spongiactinospora sp. TRM90649 TaxID=3031114 RepID=UPI0023F80558|nr:hypothetical protein [Spongiactinospora sp. TRM90649]MDF5756620.1 hypothetical protein [Spongiactinospora sp. TRM90649]
MGGDTRNASPLDQKADIMRKIMLLVGSCLMLLAVLAAPSAATAQSHGYPQTAYNVQYGNSYVKGNLIWYNRSVQVGGELRAASGCRDVVYTVYPPAGNNTILSREERSACNGTVGHGFTMSANVPGGAGRVYVDLYENGVLREWVICIPTGC